MKAIVEYLEEAGITPTRGTSASFCNLIRKEGIKTELKYHKEKQSIITHADIPQHVLKQTLSQIKHYTPLFPKKVKEIEPEPKIDLGMAPDVFILLKLFKGHLSSYMIKQLEIIAPYLDGKQATAKNPFFKKVADQLKVTESSFSSYIRLIHKSYLWAMEESDFADEKLNRLQRADLEFNAILNVPGYEGVKALITQKITDRGKYLQIKRDLLEAENRKGKPEDRIKGLEREVELWQIKYNNLTQEMNKKITEVVSIKPKLPALPTNAGVKTIANYLEKIAEFGDPNNLINFMEAAETLRRTTIEHFPLPSHLTWYGRDWYSAIYTDWFKKDYEPLNQEQKKAIWHMLLLLSINPFHKSLNTHKPKGLTYNPPGTPDETIYSRASNNIRVFWLFNEKEKTIEFYRIIIKTG